MRLFRRGLRGTWWVQFRDPVSGREVRRSLRVTRRRSAESMAHDLAEQVARRHHRLPERKTWPEAVGEYLARGELYKMPATTEKNRHILTKSFRPPDVVKYVDDIREEHIMTHVVQQKAQGLSPFTINRELRALRAFFNFCAAPRRLWIPDNPAAEIPLLREPTGAAARALSEEELSALLAATAGTRLEGPVLLALNHGLREGEIIHLRREAVDVTRGTLWIRHDPLTGWFVKNGQERMVCLNAATRPWLARHLAEPVPELCPYVFRMAPGRAWTREALVMAMRRVMRRIGITRGGFHLLRHHWATCQAEAGTPLPVLKAMGGWLDWRSMATYQHVGDAAQRQAAARVVIAPRPDTGQLTERVVSLDRERARRATNPPAGFTRPNEGEQ